MTSDYFIIPEWNTLEELVPWLTEHVGYLIWTNGITDWIGWGWVITRVSGGFQVGVDDPQKCTLALLKWT